jgi:hypothetical protein
MRMELALIGTADGYGAQMIDQHPTAFRVGQE